MDVLFGTIALAFATLFVGLMAGYFVGWSRGYHANVSEQVEFMYGGQYD